MDNDFVDILEMSQDSLKEVWDNEKDDIWSSYLADNWAMKFFPLFILI